MVASFQSFMCRKHEIVFRVLICNTNGGQRKKNAQMKEKKNYYHKKHEINTNQLNRRVCFFHVPIFMYYIAIDQSLVITSIILITHLIQRTLKCTELEKVATSNWYN